MGERLSTPQTALCGRNKAGPIAAAAVIAGGTLSYAQPVRFENPEKQFVWKNQDLDLTRPYDMQPGTAGPTTVNQSVNVTAHPYPPPSSLISASALGLAALARVYGYGYLEPYWRAAVVSEGTIVNGSFDFSGGNKRHFASWSFTPNITYWQNLFVPRYGTFYLPVRFMNGADAHYGWIAGEWGREEGVRALAWGYELTPDTPIAAGAVPAPGTLAALAFGAMVMGRRPNRDGRSGRVPGKGIGKSQAK